MEWKSFANGSVKLFNAPLFPVHIPLGDGRCSCGQDHKEDNSLGKHPRCLHGFKEATTNEKQIERWIKQFSFTNWGIATGALSNVVILDQDPRNGGFQSYKELFPHGLPDTFTVQSGGGGFHFYYLYDAVFGRSEKDFAPGLDYLANGSYALTPPSLHKSGGRYEVYADLPIAPLPEELKAILRIAKEKPERDFDMDWKETIKEGGRNNKLAQLAGKLFSINLDFPVVYSTLLHQNQIYCEPPLERLEVRSIAVSIAATDKRNKEKKKAEQEAKRKAEEELKAAKGPTRFNLIDYKTIFMKVGHEPIQWLILDWMPMSTTGFIIADPQAWKSWFAYAMGYAIGSGKPFLGQFPVERTGPVIHLNQEDDLAIYADRMRLYTNMPYGNPNEILEDLPIYHPANFGPDGKILPGTLLNFTDPESVYAFERDILKPMRPLLCTIDPFYTCIPAKDSFMEAPYHMQMIKTWARTYDCAFMIVHHMNKGKPGTRLRDNIMGSALLNAWQETSYAFELTDNPNVVRMEKHLKRLASFEDKLLSYNFTPEGMKIDLSDVPEDYFNEKPARVSRQKKTNVKEPGVKNSFSADIDTVAEQEHLKQITMEYQNPTWIILMKNYNRDLAEGNVARFTKRAKELGYEKIGKTIIKPHVEFYDPEEETRNGQTPGRRARI